MSKSHFSATHPLVKRQQEKSWQQFSQQYPDATANLKPDRLMLFKQALALSDFILRSALQAPELVIELLKGEQLLSEFTPDYRAN